MLTTEAIHQHLLNTVGEEAIGALDEACTPKAIWVKPASIAAVCELLHRWDKTYFDQLSCLTALDNGPEVGTMEVIYNLYSIPYQLQLMVKVELPREQEGGVLPELPSVSHIWRTADWHEREAYDLVGIRFTNHPDLRRILLPADWEGYPLRRDYEVQEYYHGIKVKYES